MPGARQMTRAACACWLLACLSCGSSRGVPEPGHGAWLGDTHARAGERSGDGRGQGEGRARARVSSPAEARAWLERALADGAHAEVIRAIDAYLAVSAADPGRASGRASEQAGLELPDDMATHLLAGVDALSLTDADALYGELLPWAPPARLVAFRAALLAEHTGDDQAALAWLERAEHAGAAGSTELAGVADLAGKARAMRRRVNARGRVDVRSIAVLLPLSGRFAAVGKELRAAIALAREHDKGDVELVFLDTQGTPEGARAAVERAVYDQAALAILGPVGERESMAAAARATDFGVPIALLAPGAGVTSGPASGVFRLWSSSEWEAREAVRVAVDLGYDRLAVLAPRDEHGDAAARAFQDAASAHQVEVVAVGSYDPTVGDLEPDIKSFLGLDPRENRRLAAHLRRHGRKQGWKSFSPDVPFELLYIPDEYQRASLVAAYLPYFNVELRTDDIMDIEYLKKKHLGRVPQVVQLLGSSGWHHPSLPARGGSAIEGALLLDVYAGGDAEEFSGEAAERFAEAYAQRTGRPASAFAAQAYDAAALVLAGARAASLAPGKGDGREARAAVRQALARGYLANGVCGRARMGESGAIERQAVVLSVRGGAFVVHEY